MSRWIPALLACMPLACMPAAAQVAERQDKPQLQRRNSKTPPAKSQTGLPVEEDESVATREYGFNPVQAQKEITVGNQYFKKGSYRAAAGRFEEATKWNSGDPEAWLRLGEASEKMKDKKAAHDAYAKYLELAGDAKNADDIRKKMGRLSAAK
jgi:tetratricopeptide (TPR) repeat protein